MKECVNEEELFVGNVELDWKPVEVNESGGEEVLHKKARMREKREKFLAIRLPAHKPDSV